MYRAVADAVGSVVSTSTKPDVLLNTVALRQRDGRRVWVFDPQEISGWPKVLRWSPTRGCEDPTTAMVRAAGMAEASQVGKGVTNGDFWAGQTAAVIRCYLHAAAIGGQDRDRHHALGPQPQGAGADHHPARAPGRR